MRGGAYRRTEGAQHAPARKRARRHSAVQTQRHSPAEGEYAHDEKDGKHRIGNSSYAGIEPPYTRKFIFLLAELFVLAAYCLYLSALLFGGSGILIAETAVFFHNILYPFAARLRGVISI